MKRLVQLLGILVIGQLLGGDGPQAAGEAIALVTSPLGDASQFSAQLGNTDPRDDHHPHAEVQARGLDELPLPVEAVVAAGDRACVPDECSVPSRVLDPLGTDPLWSGRADAVILWRSQPQSSPLFEPLGGQRGLNAADFASEMAAGPRFSLFRHTNDLGAIEFNFLRVQDFAASVFLPETQGGYVETPRGIFCCPSEIPVDAVEGRYTSGFQSFELNRRFPTDGSWQWLTGFRWVQWSEEMWLASPYAGGLFTDTYATRTWSDLYGWQVGGDAILWGSGGPLRMEGLGKAGVYYNRSAQRSATTVGAMLPPATLDVATDVARAAFVGELGVTGVYDITTWLSVRAGYTVFWLSGIATAPDQLAAQVLCPGQAIQGATATGGSVVVQGITVGLEGRW